MTQQRSFMSVLGNFLGTNTTKESMTTYTQEQRNKVIAELRHRAEIALACLPDAPFRKMLGQLFDDMLAAPSTSYIQNVPDKCDRIVWRNKYYHLENLRAAPSTSQAEVEQLRVQLAGCGVAAMQNTEASRAERAKPDDYGYSGSYAEVCKAVDREIALRAAQSTSLTFEDIAGAVARGWCSPDNSHKVMDSDLGLAITGEVQALIKGGE